MSKFVIRGEAAQRLKKYLANYRNADDELYECMKENCDAQTLRKANIALHHAEARLAILVDVFAEEIEEKCNENELSIS